MTLPASTARTAGALSRIACLALPALPARAHHAMDGQTPTTVAHGLLSGLAHPVIELDHLLFLLGAAVLVALAGRAPHVARWALAAFVAAGAGGTLLHAQGVDLPAAEIGVALSLCAVSVGLLRPPAMGAWLLPLALAGGLLHGYAYGESIIGAEPRPLGAYLAGLALVQLLMAVAVHGAVRRLAAQRPALQAPLRRALAVLLGLTGAWALGVSAI